MKCSNLIAVMVLILSCLLLEARGVNSLVISKATGCRIVVPVKFSEDGNVQRLLDGFAKDLQKAFQETLGFKPAILKEDQFQDDGKPALFLGNTTAIQGLGIKPGTFENFNGIIATRGNHIYIAGNDRDRFGCLNVGKRFQDCILGTVKAGIVFMEDYLNVRFLLPGTAGTDYLPAESVAIPRNLTREITPKLIFATGRNATMLYQYSNNNYGAGSFFSYGGHSYYDACPTAVYGKTHPEYFIMKGGKRDPSANHLCISNPEVQELIYQEALKRLDAGATTVQLAQTDGYQPCGCDKCKAFANTDDIGEKLWVLHRSLAERLLKDRPGKNMHIICYGPTAAPPKTFDSFPDNVIIELCNYTKETFANWSKIRVKQGFTVYIYNWGFYQLLGITPKTTPDFCAAQVRLFIKNNVKGIYRCGFGELWGLEGPCYYVYGKMIDDVHQNHLLLLEEYYKRCFGDAYAPMRTFYNTLYERLWSQYVYSMRNRGFEAEPISSYSVLPKNPRIVLGAIYTPDLIDTLDTNLSRAEAMATTPQVKARLKLVRVEFDYMKNLGSCISFYNAYRFKPTKENFEQLADAVQARNEMIDGFYDEKGRMKTLPEMRDVTLFGGISKAMFKVNGRLRAPLAAPFTWNVQALRKAGVLPGLATRKMTVLKAAGAVGTDFEAGAWAGLPWQELGGVQLNEVDFKNRFKATYDGENLYFAVEAQVDAGFEYQGFGKDGACWREDCLEVMIDPSGMRQSYYHFIANPMPESRYDAAVGFIADPLDPRYGQADTSWDGEWQCKSVVKDGLWSALIIVPFKTIGGNTPLPGAHWTWNIGREAYRKDAVGKEKLHPQLMLWSPNLEDMGFHSIEAFGDVVFE